MYNVVHLAHFSSLPNGISIGSAIFVRHIHVTSVAVGLIYAIRMLWTNNTTKRCYTSYTRDASKISKNNKIQIENLRDEIE